jgi:hypothetical protein
MASTKATATSRANARPAPIFPFRDGRDEQRMHSIPKRRSASSKNAQNLKTTQTDLPPIAGERQSAGPLRGRRIRAVVLPLPHRHPEARA